MTAADLARVDVPLVELERRALAKRQARAERLERKRVEHLRGHMPLDDPDRHDIDLLDRAFAHIADNYTAGGTS